MSIRLPGLGPDQVLAFALVFTRMIGMMLMAPLFSGRSMPNQIKIMMALGLTLVLLPILPTGNLPSGVGDQIALIFKELVVGLLFGLVIGVIAAAWQFAGAMLDLSMGFSYGGVLDPLNGNQSSIMQQLYGMLSVIVFMAIGGDHWLLQGLARSFTLIPLDQAAPAGDLAKVAVEGLISTFTIGFGVAGPVLIALLITDVAFGLVSRVAPQTQVIQIEFPVKITVGILVLVASIPFMAPFLSSSLEHLLRIFFGG